MDFSTPPTADWHQVVNRYYRKREIYSMAWDGSDIDISLLLVVAAPNGGPIAVTRDEKQIQVVKTGNLKPSIQIFTSSGYLISSFVWEKSRLVGMGWSEGERLLCVLEDGTVLMYSVFGELISQFSMGRDCKEQGVLDIQVWSSGLVALTHNLQLFAVTSLEDPRPRALADPGLENPPTSWVAVDPLYTISHSVEVFLATTSGTILAVDHEGVKDQLLSQGPFKKMAVSPTGKLLACFTENGDLWVSLSDFSKDLYQFPTKSKVPPKQMVWCGSDAVVLYWDKILLMITSGDWMKFTYEDPVYLIGEVDGTRIISNSLCEFLQRVPDSTEEIFRIGSTSPAAMLFDAAEHFEKKSPKADENIRSIRADLASAVAQCISAAGHEFSYPLQRQLLKAASFGKCFLEFYPSEPFVEMCKTLRVLNAVRYYEIGIPLTYEQYKQLTPEVLIECLINRHQHLLAWKICEYLKIKGDKVMVHWACTKVKTSADDSEITNLIVQKLEKVPGVSYAEIASAAYKFGRPRLATMLLDYEPRAADQVPLLISMQEDELALSKAIESGDTDLMYLVLLHIKRTKPIRDFMQVVHNKPAAMDLLIAYCKQQDLDLLKDLYIFYQEPDQLASTAILESYQQKDLDERLKGLQSAMRYYNESKEHQFQARQTEEQIKLLLVQKELEATIEGTKFVDLSLSDTIYRLCVKFDIKRATKIRSEFKVPDKRFWWIRIKAVAETRDWEGLEKLAKEKKSPIGYEPFIDVCIEGKALQEAVKYIPKLAEAEKRIEYFMKVGAVKEAADVAMKEKNPDMLLRIRDGTTNREHLQYVDMFLSQFQAKK
eukprot:TRINITY_DN2060_c0_g1_i1.p1 TRINITY_DN2060_c0_g1~~TRINITY_DN2060_c0_g1_i1.p1  ORF type:complete len:827 (+),score=180.52 TRINITY_DN2060_c0_g1_i1:187-2667(+)